jgi:hypothetical protein
MGLPQLDPSAIFNGVRNDISYWCYNNLLGSTGSKITEAEPQLKIAIEANYFDGASNLTEFNIDYLSPDGLTSIRPVAIGINRGTQDCKMTFAIGALDIASEAGVLFAKFWKTSSTRPQLELCGGNGLMIDQVAGTAWLAMPGAGIQIINNLPTLLFDKSTSSNNNKIWTFEVNSETQLSGYVYKDDFSGPWAWLIVTRNQSQISKINFQPWIGLGIWVDTPSERLDVSGNINTSGVIKIDTVQVVSNRVIDARCDDAINSGDATTDGVIDALRDCLITHGLIAAA